MLVFSYSYNLEGKSLSLLPDFVLSIMVCDIRFDNDFEGDSINVLGAYKLFS